MKFSCKTTSSITQVPQFIATIVCSNKFSFLFQKQVCGARHSNNISLNGLQEGGDGYQDLISRHESKECFSYLVIYDSNKTHRRGCHQLSLLAKYRDGHCF